MRSVYKRGDLRKWISILLCMSVMLLFCGCGKENTDLEPATETESQDRLLVGNYDADNRTDVVLVMDESGSMVHADEERLAIEGAKLFVDMEKSSGAGIALVEFSNQIMSTGLAEIQRQEDKDYIKGILNEVQYSRTAHTDTGAGLLEAISVLDSAPVEDNKVILLFTDGNTDIDAGTPGRTTEDSLNDVETAISLAEQKGYRIYCIGLNADGKVDEQRLADMAVRTGGQHKIATDVNELLDFFNAIFADIDQSVKQKLAEYSADGSYQDVTFTIENSSVMEANIAVLSSKQVEDIILYAPSGNEIDLENSSGEASFENSSKYSLVKLYYPEPGEWRISVKGVSGDYIKVELIYSYNMNLAVEAESAAVVRGDDITLAVYLISQGKKVEDAAIYQSLSGTATVTDMKSGAVFQNPLSLSEAGNGLMAAFPASECTTYNIRVHVEGNGFYRDSENFSVEVYKNPPMTKLSEEEQISVLVNKTVELALDDYFVDADGDELSYTVESGDTQDNIIGEIQGNKLAVTSGRPGEYLLTVYADNGAPERAEQKFSVNCSTFVQRYGIFLLIPVAVAVILLVLFLIRKSKEQIYGAFAVQFFTVKKNEYGVTEEEVYRIRQVIRAENIGKRGFTIAELLSLLPSYYSDTDREKKERLEVCIGQLRSDASKIRVSGSRKPFEIRLQNNSVNAKLVIMNSPSERRKAVISLENSKFGIGTVMEKEFGVRFVVNENIYHQITVKYKKM